MGKVIRISDRTENLIKEIREIYKEDITMNYLKDEQILQTALALWRCNYLKIDKK